MSGRRENKLSEMLLRSIALLRTYGLEGLLQTQIIRWPGDGPERRPLSRPLASGDHCHRSSQGMWILSKNREKTRMVWWERSNVTRRTCRFVATTAFLEISGNPCSLRSTQSHDNHQQKTYGCEQVHRNKIIGDSRLQWTLSALQTDGPPFGKTG